MSDDTPTYTTQYAKRIVGTNTDKLYWVNKDDLLELDGTFFRMPYDIELLVTAIRKKNATPQKGSRLELVTREVSEPMRVEATLPTKVQES